MKSCSRCRETKSPADFSKNRRSKDGLQSRCKRCCVEVVTRWAKANPDKVLRNQRKYDAVHRDTERDRKRQYSQSDRGRECKRIWRNANLEAVRSYQRLYRAANLDRIRKLFLQWKRANAEHYASQQRLYRQSRRSIDNARRKARRHADPEAARRVARRRYRMVANSNPERLRVHVRNRKSRLRAADGSHTADDVQRIGDAQRWRCANCTTALKRGGRKVYHVDHIVALARGGRNDKSNLQLLCPPCNHRKNALDPIDFAQREGRLL